jgi:SAM-dependent methyltransferase
MIYRDSKEWYCAQGQATAMASRPHLEFCVKYSGKSILDLGCATGSYCIEFAKAGHACVGADINPDYVKAACQSGVEAYLVTGGRLPFEDKSFDTVVMIEVLEHVKDIPALFAEVKRIARKNVIITVPNCDGFDSLRACGFTYEHFLELDHVNFFTGSSLKKVLSDDFADVAVEETVPLLPWFYTEPRGLAHMPAVIIRKAVSLFSMLGILRPKYYSCLFAVAKIKKYE